MQRKKETQTWRWFGSDTEKLDFSEFTEEKQLKGKIIIIIIIIIVIIIVIIVMWELCCCRIQTELKTCGEPRLCAGRVCVF